MFKKNVFFYVSHLQTMAIKFAFSFYDVRTFVTGLGALPFSAKAKPGHVFPRNKFDHNRYGSERSVTPKCGTDWGG